MNAPLRAILSLRAARTRPSVHADAHSLPRWIDMEQEHAFNSGHSLRTMIEMLSIQLHQDEASVRVSRAKKPQLYRLMKALILFSYGGGGGSRTRVRNRSQQRDSMLSRVPKVSLYALRTDKIRVKLVRGSHPHGPYPAIRTSLLCDVLSKPADKAAEDGYLIN